jgi:tetratricopeptide (TPR) repeat protein
MTMMLEKAFASALPGPITTPAKGETDVPTAAHQYLLEGDGFYQQGKYKQARDAYAQALEYTESLPQAWFNLALSLCLLLKPAEAHDAFERAFQLREGLKNNGRELYRIWAILTLAQGFDGLMQQNLHAFEEAGLKYIDILEKAEQDGLDDVVEEARAQFRASINKKKELKAFEELELFINLMKIKDPFEGWRAIGKVVSERWPKGLDCVKAVREIRR